MSQPAATHPPLSPKFCFNQTALRDFLRLSRSSVDDSITQALNALLAPSRTAFDPTSTSTRQILPPLTTKRLIDPQSCATFRTTILFPSWQSRSDVLSYCASVATSADPEDPELILRQVESARERERVVDERLDPYSGRFFPREPRTEALANAVRNERAVEGIIRARTWGLVGERCGDLGLSWEEALDRWRMEREGRR